MNYNNNPLSKQSSDELISHIKSSISREINDCYSFLSNASSAERNIVEHQNIIKDNMAAAYSSFLKIEKKMERLLAILNEQELLSNKEQFVSDSSQPSSLDSYLARNSSSFDKLMEKFNNDDCY